MALVTTLVTGYLYGPTGAPLANTAVTIRLTEQDNEPTGIVITPTDINVTTSALGLLSVALWPNTRGTSHSQYRLQARIFTQTGYKTVVDRVLTVPDTGTADLSAILDAAAPDNQSTTQAIIAAQAASASQVAASASQVGAQGSAQASSTSAGSALNSEISARTDANRASIFAQHAGDLSDQAGVYANAAQQAAILAENVTTDLSAQVNAAQAAANASGVSAETAATYAASAINSGITASNQAANAVTSANAAAASATSASNSATAAANSVTSASNSASAAATSATNAGNSATSATNSASAASGSASSAATSASNAAASAASVSGNTSAAAASANAAAASANQSSQYATNSGNSATASASSATTASNAQSAASSSASAAATSASNASGSASTASTQATNAAGSASAANTSAGNANSSASAASSSASAASNSASAASTSATNAANSATAAASSASAASGSASTASTQATNAGNSASAASTSATNAASSATSASSSASTATTQASNASTSATNAASSATAAASSASAASTSQTSSASSATAANTYATQAMSTGKIFNNTTDGLAGSSSSGTTNRYFLTPSPNNLNFVALYYNNGGTANLIRETPAIGLMLQILGYFDNAAPNMAISFLDKVGGVAGGFMNDGTWAVSKASISTLLSLLSNIVISDTGAGTANNIIEVKDNSGNLAIWLDKTGVFNVQSLVAKAYSGPGSSQNIVNNNIANYAEINHFMHYGQSLGNGQQGKIQSTVQNYDNLKFQYVRRYDQEMQTTPPTTYYNQFYPLVETGADPIIAKGPGGDGSPVGNLGETPATGSADMVKQLLLNENGLNFSQRTYQILASCPAVGGMPLANLVKGASTPYYQWCVDDITNGYRLAQAAGKSYKFHAMGFVHGETDQEGAASQSNIASYMNYYMTGIEGLRASLESDCGAVYNRKGVPLIMIIDQMCAFRACAGLAQPARSTSAEYPTIAMAQFNAANTYPNIYLGVPSYCFADLDGLHSDGFSYRYMSAHTGVIFKRRVIDGNTAKHHINPINIDVEGKIILVKFTVPVGNLAFRYDLVSANANNGFAVVDSAGNLQTIVSTAIVNNDTVKIVLSATAPTGGKVRYAFYGDPANGSTDVNYNQGKIHGPRGNLADSQGDNITFSIASSTTGAFSVVRVDCYCPQFEMAY